MPITKVEIRNGVYYDSATLMQVQAFLTKLPGIKTAGIMMGTAANKELLKQSGLLQETDAMDTDLIISIQGDSQKAVDSALGQIESLFSRRRSQEGHDYRPKTIEAATKMLPEAAWVLVSVPGKYAADVAKESLRLAKNIFFYSDNVAVQAEISLKTEAVKRGLLVMGPDCGTAIINGIGLGFANKIRRGPIGLVGASGTGLQHVTTRIHQLGSGITHAIGTGGRDLSREVGGITALQGLDLLLRDPETKVIVLISKPPHPQVAARLLASVRFADKPVVVNFIGHPSADAGRESNLHFATSLDAAAARAVELLDSPPSKTARAEDPGPASGSRYLRGLFSGGTLAYETLLVLQDYLPNVFSNTPLRKDQTLPDPLKSLEHTILDLGEDLFTVGRPHPMLDNTLRLQRLAQEANDPKVAIILLDVVLGYGAHPDPASELAPAISKALAAAKKNGGELEVVAVVIGTDEDPQDLDSHIERLKAAGAKVTTSAGEAAAYAGQRLQRFNKPIPRPLVDSKILLQPLRAINVGLESFTESLRAQEAEVVHVDWRPPAGGNEKLMSILERMKRK